jgi:predicted dehydrogenase
VAGGTGERLGVGFVGSGFITKFHLQSFVGVRDADVRGVWSPTAAHAREAARYARILEVGEARSYRSISEMVSDPAIQAVWICGPNYARVANVEELVSAAGRRREHLLGVACEKPLARNVAEARHVSRLVKRARINHGYLENQLFAPAITRGREISWARGASLTGRPYLARAAEEHSGPHMPWFWQGKLQGGGVLNDMMCHSVEVVRFLLTRPGDPRSSLRPRRISARIASLKWTRPEYARRLARLMGKSVDYRRRPAEDFASVTIEYEDQNGHMVVAEASTSWGYVGAGLRITAELLGPEYSMSVNTLESGLRLFFSRHVKGKAGEDLVEKQNAETGLMPVVAGEATVYGYEAENRHFVRAFLRREAPMLTFEDGVSVMEILMTAYQSAERGRTLTFPPRGLGRFMPAVSQGRWRPA